MPSKFGGIEVTPATPTGGSKFGGVPVDQAPSAPSTPDQAGGGFWSDFGRELWQQGGQSLLQSFQEHPIGTLAHLLGSAAGISTGTTPVPGHGGQIQVGGPTQMASVADVAERGPAAIAAATTLSALPIALGLGGKAAAGSRVGQATGAALQAGKEALPNAIETSALRYTGLPQLVRPMVKAFKGSLAETGPKPTPTAPVVPPPDPAALAAAARTAELEDFAPGFSKLSPREQAITEMAYNRIKSGPPPSSAPPAGKIAPLYAPPPEPSAQTPAVAPTVPQAAPPAPPATAAPIPPEAPRQATVAPPAAKAGPSAAEIAQTKARGLRAATAETLSQALSDAGKTSAEVRGVRVWDWPKIANQVGVDFPVTHSARLKLIRDTLGQLEQKEAAAPKTTAVPPLSQPSSIPQEPSSISSQSSSGPPSLGTTGRDIYQGWKQLAEGTSPPRAVIEGYVPGLGRFDFRGGQIVRLMKQQGKRGIVSTYTPATADEIAEIHDAIDKGQFQVEQRTISGAGGVRQFEGAGALEKVFHQATGRPTAEFLATPKGQAWAKRVGYTP